MNKKFTILITFLLTFFALPKAVFGFGITPAEIYVDQLKPGTKVEREIYITRPVDEAGDELDVVIDQQLGEMESWFSYVPGRQFKFPAGKNTTTFKVIIDVPSGVELKEYKGQITAKGVASKKASSGVTIVKGAVLGVNVVASDVDLYDLEVLSIEAPDVNSGDPVRLLLNIENKGNVAIAPDRVNLDVMDLFEKPLEKLTTTNLEKIDAFSTKKIQASFNSNLEKGQYRVDASVIFMGEEIAKKKMVLTVNATPSKVDEDLTQTQQTTPASVGLGASGPVMAIALMSIGLIVMSLVVINALTTISIPGLASGDTFFTGLKNKRSVTIILVSGSLTMVVLGLYLLLNQVPSGGDVTPVSQESALNSEKGKTEDSEKDSASESGAMMEEEVKGVSVTSSADEEDTSTLVIKRPGTPGKYPIYENPSFSAKIIYEAEDGEKFDVAQQSGQWYQVVLDDGTVGWLHETSIKTKI